MDPGRLFDELLGIAARAGLEVRTRSFRNTGKAPFAGGRCSVLGKQMVLLNLSASVVERSVALADALAGLAASELTMSHEVRRFLTERARSHSGLVEPELAPGPGLAKTAATRKKKPHQR